MTTKAHEELRALREGMFEMPDSIEEAPHLYGQRCLACREVFASTERRFCANCGKDALERIKLGTRGIVHTFTIVHQQLKGSLMHPPYVIARVRLPEGVTVQGVLTDVDPHKVAIDMPVETCLKQVAEDETGCRVVASFFRPAGR